MFRHVRDVGLAYQYTNDNQFSIHVKMLSSLAFVPIPDVVRSFEALGNVFPPAGIPVLEYFEENFIGTLLPGQQQRRTPRFPIATWNINGRVVNNLPRTNNHVEGWHNKFANHVGANHPSIWKFLNVLKNEERMHYVSIVQMTAGYLPPVQRAKYRDCTQRIANIVHNYANRHILDLLRGIAHNISS